MKIPGPRLRATSWRLALLAPVLLIANGLITLTSCGGLSSEQGLQLETYVQNAGSYYDGGDFARALDQIERGLVLDPDHYQLQLLRGQIYARQARRNPELYDAALEQMRKVYDLRSLSSHDYRVPLLLGQVHLGLALRHRRSAEEAREAAGAQNLDANERTRRLAEAEEHDRLYRQHMNDADRTLRSVLELEDGAGRFAAQGSLIKVETFKSEGLEGEARTAQIRRAIAVSEAYLAEARDRLAHYKELRAATMDLREEAAADRRRSAFIELVAETLRQLAGLHAEIGEYAQALAYNDELVERHPNVAVHYYDRGLCHYQLGHWEAAVRDFQDYLRMTGEELGKRRDEVEAMLEKASAAMRR